MKKEHCIKRTPRKIKQNQSIRYTTLIKEYAKDVAKIHCECIATGFLSHLGKKFLSCLYSAINDETDSKVWIALNSKNELVGFISAACNTNIMYKRILKKHTLKFALLLLPKAINPLLLKKIFETLLYSKSPNGKKKVSSSNSNAELLSIAVDSNYRGYNIGRNLLQRMENFFIEHAINEYKVVTSEKQIGSNAFYQKCGFSFSRSFRHHENKMNEYTKKVRNIK